MTGPAPKSKSPDARRRKGHFRRGYLAGHASALAGEHVEFEAIRAGLARDIVRRIAHVADAVGFQAGEPAMEIAGQIVSVLAANPEHVDRFLREGAELFLDGTLNVENGCLTYRAAGGAILSPSDLRRRMGKEQ